MNVAQSVPILEFANALAIGGTERQFVNLVCGIDPAMFRVHVGTLSRTGELLGEIDQARVPVTEYRIRHLYGPGAMRQQLRLATYLARNQVRLIHTHGFYANTFALPPAWLARTPVRIASIRDDGSVWTPAQRAVDRIACRLADCTVVNAEMIRRRLIKEGWRDDRIAVIPNGVDTRRFQPRTGQQGIRKELGLSETAPLVGVLARLAPSKGLEVFIEAARLIAERFPDARFLIVGDEGAPGEATPTGGYRQTLVRHAERLGLADRVIFTGFRLDVPEVLAELAVSVLPSVTGEGLPNSVLESMAAGVAVVATNSGGTREAVADGETGMLVPPTDVTALVQAINRLLEDSGLRARYGAAGRRRIADRFSRERMAHEMQSLYSRLLEARERQALPRPIVAAK
jgi:glycosyltransferase involved in cell wall biosynthesis